MCLYIVYNCDIFKIDFRIYYNTWNLVFDEKKIDNQINTPIYYVFKGIKQTK